nr:N-acetylmuramoyl-L-alanine amidase [uncultured Brevibacillus sp.]
MIKHPEVQSYQQHMSIDGLKFLIDPGHGGSQSGATGTLNGKTIYEKDLNLMFAESVATSLEDLEQLFI